jgi:hypothetical protein
MLHYLSRSESGTEYQAWSLPPPRVEAKALFTMLGRNGDTEESLLKLIRVAPREQAALRGCAARYHELSVHIERALRFREKVEEEFKRLAEMAVSSPQQVERKQDKGDSENGDNPDRAYPERQPCEFVEKGTND